MSTPATSTPVAYKIMTAREFEHMRREGQFRGSAADLADGFIHLSTAGQLAGTIDRHFQGQPDLVVLAVDLGWLADTVRWEPSRGGQLFPHIYGTLPMKAVIAAGPLDRSADGTVRLPG
jgi:uncharacterized protein (DUF952 family)